MRINEAAVIALQQLGAGKLRSFLTLLGIIIGITAVITLMGVGSGAVTMISGQFDAIGTNLVFVQWQWDEDDSTWKNLKEEDVAAIKKGSDLVTNVTPYNSAYAQVKAEKETQYINISGVGEGFLRLQGLKLDHGRFFNLFEASTGKNVCVLGYDLHKKLFDKSDGVGRTVRIEGKKFTVLGVMEKKDERSFVNTGLTDNMRLYMPHTTVNRLWRRGDRGYPLVMANPLEVELTKAAVGQLKGILARLYGPKNKFQVESLEEIMERTLSRLKLFSVFLAGLGGISLLVGGIGIMNIMLVSVKERTQEIGIRKALGAKNHEILLQFLVESVILCLVGGVCGLLLGVLAVSGIKSLSPIPAEMTVSAVIMAVGCALAIGLFFGIYPAWKAALLDPIESLRYE